MVIMQGWSIAMALRAAWMHKALCPYVKQRILSSAWII